MSDETNRAVQAPTHAATAVIYGADASGMENQASGEGRGDLKRSASLTVRSAPDEKKATALIKRHATDGHVRQYTGRRVTGALAK